MAPEEQCIEINGQRVEIVPNHFIGAIDQAFLTLQGAYFTGWSILNPAKEAGPALPAQFAVVSEKGVVLTTAPNHPRRDIARKFGEEMLCCGLKLDLGLDLIPPPLVAKFDFLAYDGKSTATRLSFHEPNNALRDIAIRSAKDFTGLIQNPSTRTTNKRTQLYVSLHALSRFPDNFLVCAGAACVAGYRILEHETHEPEARAIFHAEIGRLLNMRPDIAKGPYLRWHTSLRLIAAYINYQEGNRQAALHHFDCIVDFLADLPAWPTALTNFLIGIYGSGYLLFEAGSKQEAIARWRKAAEVLRFGMELAKFTSYHAYDELNNALRVARECHMAVLVAQAGGPLHDPALAPVGLGLDPRTAPGPIGRLSAEYRAATGEADPVASYKGIRPR